MTTFADLTASQRRLLLALIDAGLAAAQEAVRLGRGLVVVPETIAVQELPAKVRYAAGQRKASSIRGRPPTSTFKGVTVASGRFHARITVGGRGRRLGSFTDEIDAARAYDEAARAAFGAAARTNF